MQRGHQAIFFLFTERVTGYLSTKDFLYLCWVQGSPGSGLSHSEHHRLLMGFSDPSKSKWHALTKNKHVICKPVLVKMVGFLFKIHFYDF